MCQPSLVYADGCVDKVIDDNAVLFNLCQACLSHLGACPIPKIVRLQQTLITFEYFEA